MEELNKSYISVVLNTNFVLVTYNSKFKIGKVEWKGNANSEEYQRAFMTLIEYSEIYQVLYFLSDITNQSVVSPANRKWFEEVMIPMAIKKGLKKAATVFDGNVFKKYYVNMIIKVTNKFSLPLKVFNNEEDAVKWFLNN